MFISHIQHTFILHIDAHSRQHIHIAHWHPFNTTCSNCTLTHSFNTTYSYCTLTLIQHTHSYCTLTHTQHKTCLCMRIIQYNAHTHAHCGHYGKWPESGWCGICTVSVLWLKAVVEGGRRWIYRETFALKWRSTKRIATWSYLSVISVCSLFYFCCRFFCSASFPVI